MILLNFLVENEELREFVHVGDNGLLVLPADAVALASALTRVLNNHTFAVKLGMKNYRVTCEQHDGRLNATRFTEVYTRVA